MIKHVSFTFSVEKYLDCARTWAIYSMFYDNDVIQVNMDIKADRNNLNRMSQRKIEKQTVETSKNETENLDVSRNKHLQSWFT